MSEVKISHEKAIELLRLLRDTAYPAPTQDEKTALTMALVALITEKLNLER